MTSKTASKIDYEQCVIYYRAGRRMAEATAIERYLAANPRTAERAARDAERDLALAQRYDPVLDEPIPPRLLHDRGTSSSNWLAGAAGLITVIGLSMAGGWWLHGLEPGPSSTHSMPASFGQQVARLSDRQPAIDAAARTSAHTSHPDLSRAGYHFSGQHLVATGGQTLTAYEYQNAAGQRVTIYARPRSGGAGAAAPDIVSAAGVSLARWQSRGRDYALTGDLAPAMLDQLADTASASSRGSPSGNTAAPSAPANNTPRQQAPATESQPIEHTSAQQQPSSGL